MRTGYLIFLYFMSTPVQAAEESLACIWTFEFDEYPLFLPFRHSNCLWDNFGLPQISWPILNIVLLWLVFSIAKKAIKGKSSTDKKDAIREKSNKPDIQPKKDLRFSEKYNISHNIKNKENLDLTKVSSTTKITEKNDGEVNLKYDDGSTYKGRMNSENQWHGYGELFYSGTGSSYIGEFKEGEYHGTGKLILKDDDGNFSTHEGHFVDGKKHGKGTTSFSSGNIITGNFVNGKVEGTAEFKFGNGDTFEGIFKEDMPNGFGIFKYIEGAVYEGEFLDGERTGKGKITYSDGGHYEGHFVDGRKHGKGKTIFSNGAVHEGEYKNDELNGKVKVKHSDGDTYIGNYKNHEPDGFGVYKYSNGDTYEGNWEDGFLKHGKYTNKAGDEYVGDFTNVKREGGYDEQFHGEGTYTYSNGETYVGAFKNNKRHGKGTLKSKDEEIIFDGLWKNDKQAKV